jgi:hypothetical protein
MGNDLLSIDDGMPAFAASHLSQDERREIERAVERGSAAYIASRLAKIPEFDGRYFSFRGAFAMHRKTWAKDVYKIPINMLWGLPAFLAQTAGAGLEKLGAKRLGQALGKAPSGLKTEFQSEINWLIETELLELPYADGARASTKDALLEAILNDADLSARCAGYLAAIGQETRTPAFQEALESRLAEYGKSKLAVSELAGNLINLAAGYAVFKQATPGVLSAGTAMATVIAQQVAVANFWLGPALGAWYYGVFPASASIGLIAASTGALMAATGILAALSMVVVDPLLAKTGFHRRRLERFVLALGEELTGQGTSDYHVKDHYLARVFDLVELLKLAAQVAGRVA